MAIDLHGVLSYVPQVLQARLLHRGLEAFGALSLVAQLLPWMLAKGVPAATRAADAVASAALSSPLKPLILWKAPEIIAFLDSFSGALDKIAGTFRDRLEADIQAAQKGAPVAPEPATQEAAVGPKAS